MNLRDANSLMTILRAAQGCEQVAFQRPTDSDVVYGTARSIGDENFNFIHDPNVDVLDLFLRVTSRNGWELALPIREILPLVPGGLFAIYAWGETS